MMRSGHAWQVCARGLRRGQMSGNEVAVFHANEFTRSRSQSSLSLLSSRFHCCSSSSCSRISLIQLIPSLTLSIYNIRLPFIPPPTSCPNLPAPGTNASHPITSHHTTSTRNACTVLSVSAAFCRADSLMKPWRRVLYFAASSGVPMAIVCVCVLCQHQRRGKVRDVNVDEAGCLGEE